MNNDFLVNPTPSDPDYDTYDIKAENVPVRITRRSFVKRTGGATVAALASWDVLSGRALAANPGQPGHCDDSGHGSYCTWITELKASFTSVTTGQPAIAGTNVSGRVFHGVVTYKKHWCGGGPPEEISIPAITGGYRADGSNVLPNNDTACPDGPWHVTPSTGNPEGGQFIGFPIPMDSTGRYSVQIHRPGYSEGCIVLTDWTKSDKFYEHIRCHNWPKTPVAKPCVHSACENPVPILVVYDGVTPVGNEPGP